MSFFFLIITLITIAFNGLGCYGGGCSGFSAESMTIVAMWLGHFYVTYSSFRRLHTIEGSLTRALNLVALLPSSLFIVGTVAVVIATLAGIG